MKHTSHQFDEDLSKLKDSLLLMGGMIESMLKDAEIALVNADTNLARKIISRDNQLDQLEKKVDQQAIQILALRQPAAGDLRFVTASMKICTDLERMADIIVNICERICEISTMKPAPQIDELRQMMKLTSEMISQALDSFVKNSLEVATSILSKDEEIDRLFRSVYGHQLDRMKADISTLEQSIKLIFVGKHLERISDHATNIAEQVIFLIKGLDIRHSDMPQATPG